MSYKSIEGRHKTNAEIKRAFGHKARPCPFCGCPSIALIVGHSPVLICAECGAKGPQYKKASAGSVETPFEAEAKALRRWNIRGVLS